MSNFKGWEILVILVLLLLLFGAKRLPDAARGLGRSLRIFKSETKGLRDDDDDREPHRPGAAQRRPPGAPRAARDRRATATRRRPQATEPADRALTASTPSVRSAGSTVT